MFSFFRRNKSRPQESDNQNTNNKTNDVNNAPPRVSVNMQLAIERQQASLATLLEQKRKNDVNDREQKEKHGGNSPHSPINRFATLPAVVSECNVLPNLSASARAHQHYDPHRDSKRAAYSTYDHFVSGRLTSNALSHNPADHLKLVASSSSSPTINERQKQQQIFSSTIADTSSTSISNPFDEVMGRGRNKNNRNNRGSNFNKRYQNNGNQNRKEVNEQSVAAVQFASNANEEKIISNENVSHATTSSSCAHDDENSCSINSMTDNTDDNITAVASDVNEKTVEIPPRDNNIVSAAASYEERQQVKRVTFAPSPPTATRSRTASIESLSDDSDGEEEETTISEDIFYEANASEVKILSTVTSHSRIDEEESAKANSAPGTITSDSLEQANKSDNNNDVVCAKIILSVNENESNEKVGDGNAFNNGITSDTSSDSNGISNEDVNDERENSPPKTIKPSYKLVGDEPIALPDILDSALPDILLEQQSHMVDADV